MSTRRSRGAKSSEIPVDSAGISPRLGTSSLPRSPDAGHRPCHEVPRVGVMSDESSNKRPGSGAFGEFIKSQRKLAELSQRELAKLADLSDAYLSQLERGLHEPSVRVLHGLSDALNVPADRLLRFLGQDPRPNDSTEQTTESTIMLDDDLSDIQKHSLLDIYRSFIAANKQT
jgi:transcriptional regulator with XRE-family HTH domain